MEREKGREWKGEIKIVRYRKKARGEGGKGVYQSEAVVTHRSMCICVCMFECVYVWIYVCMYVCMYVCVRMSVCMYVCMYACVYLNACAYVYAGNAATTGAAGQTGTTYWVTRICPPSSTGTLKSDFWSLYILCIYILYTYIYLYRYIHVCIYIYTYMYMYMHTYILLNTFT